MDHSNHDMSGHMDHSGHDMSSHMDHSSHGSDHMDHADHIHNSSHNVHGDVMHSVVNATVQAMAEAVTEGIKAMGGSSHKDIGSMDDMHSHHQHHMHHGSMDMGDMENCSGSMDHGMSMSFHFGYSETILFDWWAIDTIGGLIGSMVGIFLLSMLYEGLKYWREHLFRKSIASMQYCSSLGKGSNIDNKPIQYMEQIIAAPRVNMMSLDHFIQTMMHMLQMVISYFLMLIFMTYNVWLCLATVLGAGCGYFLFGWRKSVVVDITEHCH